MPLAADNQPRDAGVPQQAAMWDQINIENATRKKNLPIDPLLTNPPIVKLFQDATHKKHIDEQWAYF